MLVNFSFRFSIWFDLILFFSVLFQLWQTNTPKSNSRKSKICWTILLNQTHLVNWQVRWKMVIWCVISSKSWWPQAALHIVDNIQENVIHGHDHARTRAHAHVRTRGRAVTPVIIVVPVDVVVVVAIIAIDALALNLFRSHHLPPRTHPNCKLMKHSWRKQSCW